MADNPLKALDFDTIQPVEVKLGGRLFAIRPQPASVVQKVLEYSSVDQEREIVKEGDEDPRRFVRGVFGNWPDTVAAVALMLDVRPETMPTAELQETRDFLQEHLRPAVASQVFETWWEVNEIDDFFERSGRVLASPMYLRSLKLLRQAEATERAINLLATEETTSTEG